MQTLNHPLLAALSLALFLWLAYYSINYDPGGYSQADNNAMQALVMDKAYPKHPKMTKQAQNAAILDLYGQ